MKIDLQDPLEWFTEEELEDFEKLRDYEEFCNNENELKGDEDEY